MATWKIKTPDTSHVFRLTEEFKTSEIIGRVLANRDIESLESSRSFFDPKLSQLHDPFLMKDMDIAAGMVAEKVKSGGRIFIFGDYDVDGTTGSSALFLFLTSLECDAKVYIPDRIKEGYGLSREGIDVAKDWGADLLISCDCGINATDEVAYANDQNLEVIITDHHMADENLPEANAILNPKQPDCSYPFKGLCGGAVVFKLIQAVSQLLELDDDLVHQYIDLITLGTAADIVPLTDENRIIVKHGLKSLSKTKRPGLRALLEVSGLGEKELTVGRLLFWAAPRINAAGRLGDANRAVQLMTTENLPESLKLARELDEENRQRQDLQQSMVDEAIMKVNAEVDLEKEKAIVLWDDNWHEGVIGIVASKIKETYHRPAVIISLSNGTGKGSARSVKGFDLYENLTECRELLDGYGGHPMAAGLTLDRKNLEDFRTRFSNLAYETLADDDLVNSLDIEGEMDLNLIDGRFMDFLEKLAPFGPGNMTPKFITRHVIPVGNPRLVGNGDHLKFRAKKGETSYDAIGFNMGNHYEKLITGKPIDIAYVVEKNEWQGRTSIQLNIRDIK
ncbi:MAG: single-stranded-DNA-specific exonuclease RecJ [Candidatus Marinimicrobia bacterium]|jgi:single-stranded-DNA-specific exonuclease|nr:single-stranded-DNA-specific exonuclease RecJ [Candidatus Neomarinimicrobiota bacterium]MDP7120864.1 single-stranded-DNA-specific exonuclease RecJ [Candidatus Neomarinimicrobiota bacterium]MDP7529109.1 single-stranded-DNA-specific exonuclease RecJ [Candidatus Neomarinimicrobiota bacterium]HJM10515.1 single-stranded-DNA-specific exonuclease RecJ [Candidatus Neomarinimicrobiota bacterium]